MKSRFLTRGVSKRGMHQLRGGEARRGLLVAGAVACAVSVPALAGPEGAQVVNGTATISTSGSVTTITASNNAIINYQSFNIGAGQTAQFVQPGADSRVLNRITGGAPTQIDGSLLANGIVYWVNPAGVFFGPGSVVNVGGLYAAAGRISDTDFLSGVDRFTDLQGEVVNFGSVHAASEAHFVGYRVANFGSVVADNGMVTFSAGDEVYLGRRDGHVFTQITSLAADGGLARLENAGTIDAGRGRVSLSAGDHVSLALHASSVISGGTIEVRGGSGSTVTVAGRLDAANRGNAAGTLGGAVSVTGGTVLLTGATVDASGTHGGGTIHVGGEVRGGGELAHADDTLVDSGSTLRADALVSGNGGEVVVWSDGLTAFQGTISARGGAAGGNGGFVEVSGADWVIATGGIDLSAALGSAGTFLLDPDFITITADPSSAGLTPMSVDQFADAALEATGETLISQATLINWLNSANVELQAASDITFRSNLLIKVGAGNSNLRLRAGRSVLIGTNTRFDLRGGFWATVNDADPAASARREAGVGRFFMGAGSRINTSGDIRITADLRAMDGADSAAAEIVLANLTSSRTILIENLDDDATGVFMQTVGGPYELRANAVVINSASGDVGTVMNPIVLRDRTANGVLMNVAGNISGNLFLQSIGAVNDGLNVFAFGGGLVAGGGAGAVNGLTVGGDAVFTIEDFGATAALSVTGALTFNAGATNAEFGIVDGVGNDFELSSADADNITFGSLVFNTTGNVAMVSENASAADGLLRFLGQGAVTLNGSAISFGSAAAGTVYGFGGALDVNAMNGISFGTNVAGLDATADVVLDLDAGAGQMVTTTDGFTFNGTNGSLRLVNNVMGTGSVTFNRGVDATGVTSVVADGVTINGRFDVNGSSLDIDAGSAFALGAMGSIEELAEAGTLDVQANAFTVDNGANGIVFGDASGDETGTVTYRGDGLMVSSNMLATITGAPTLNLLGGTGDVTLTDAGASLGGFTNLVTITSQGAINFNATAAQAYLFAGALDADAAGAIAFGANVTGLDASADVVLSLDSNTDGMGVERVTTTDDFVFNATNGSLQLLGGVTGTGAVTFNRGVQAAGGVVFLDANGLTINGRFDANGAGFVVVNAGAGFTLGAAGSIEGLTEGAEVDIRADAYTVDNGANGIVFGDGSGDEAGTLTYRGNGLTISRNMLTTVVGRAGLNIFGDMGNVTLENVGDLFAPFADQATTGISIFSQGDLIVNGAGDLSGDEAYVFPRLSLTVAGGITFQNGASAFTLQDGAFTLNNAVTVLDGNGAADGFTFTFSTPDGLTLNEAVTGMDGVSLVFDGDSNLDTTGDVTLAGNSSITAGGGVAVNDELFINGDRMLTAGGAVTMRDITFNGSSLTIDADGVAGVNVTLGDVFSTGDLRDSLTVLTQGGTIQIGNVGRDVADAIDEQGAGDLAQNALLALILNANSGGGMGTINFTGGAYDAATLRFTGATYNLANVSTRFGDERGGSNPDTARTVEISFNDPAGALMLNNDANFFAYGANGFVNLGNVGVGGGFMGDTLAVRAEAADLVTLGAVDLLPGMDGDAQQRTLNIISERLDLNGMIAADIFDSTTQSAGRTVLLGEDVLTEVLGPAGAGEAQALVLTDAELAMLAGVFNVAIGRADSTAELVVSETTLASAGQTRLRGPVVNVIGGGVPLVRFDGGTVTLATNLTIDGDVQFDSNTVLQSDGMNALDNVLFGDARFGSNVAINSLGGNITANGLMTFILGTPAQATLDASGADAGFLDDGVVRLTEVLFDQSSDASSLTVVARDIEFFGSSYNTGGSQRYEATEGGEAYRIGGSASFVSSGADADIVFDPMLGQQLVLPGDGGIAVSAGRDAFLPIITTPTNGAETVLVSAGRNVVAQDIGTEMNRLATVGIAGRSVDSVISLGSVFTTGTQQFLFTLMDPMAAGTRVINLGGATYSSTDADAFIDFLGPVSVNADAAVSAGENGRVRFGGPVTLLANLDVDVMGGANGLIDFQGDVTGAGDSIALFRLDANTNGPGRIGFGGARVAVGDQSYTAGSYTLDDPMGVDAAFSFDASAGVGRIAFNGGAMTLNGRSLTAQADLGLGDMTASVLLPVLTGSGVEQVTLRSSEAGAVAGGGGLLGLFVTADDFSLAGGTAARDVTLRTFELADISVGTGIAGTLQITQALLNNLLASGLGQDTLLIGSDAHVGAITVNGARVVDRNTTFRTAMDAGQLTLTGAGLMADNGSNITFDTANTLLAGNVIGNALYQFTLTRGVVNVQNSSLIGTNGGTLRVLEGVANAEINGLVAGTGNLTLNAGAGALIAPALYGATRQLGSLTLIGGNTVQVRRANTSGSQLYALGGLTLMGANLAEGDLRASNEGATITVNAPVTVLSASQAVAGNGGGIIFNGPVAMNESLGLTILGGGPGSRIALNGATTGDGGAADTLTVNAGPAGMVTLATIGGAAPGTRFGTLTATGASVMLNGDVSTLVRTTLNGPALLGADVLLTSANNELLAGAQSAGGVARDLRLAGGASMLVGNFGTTARLGRFEATGGPIMLGATSFALDEGALFDGLTTVLAASRVQSFGTGSTAGIRFTSGIEGNGAASALTLITDRSLGALVGGVPNPNVPLIEIFGNVGAGTQLGALNLNFDGGAVDGRAFVPANATIVFGDVNAFAGGTQSNVTVNVGQFNMGAREKLLALGNFDLTAATARLGDIVALNNLRVNSPAVTIINREAGSVFDVTTNSVVSDSGTDFVAGGQIQFATVVAVQNLGGASGLPQFALPGGDAVVASNAGFFQVLSLTSDLPTLVRFAGDGGLTLLDVRAEGPSNTNVAEAIAGATPRQESEPPAIQRQSFDTTTTAALRDLGITISDGSSEEDSECLGGPARADHRDGEVAIAFDLPLCSGDDLRAAGVILSTDRLNAEAVPTVLTAYTALFAADAGDAAMNATLLDTAYADFTTANPQFAVETVMIDEFTTWALTDRSAEAARIRGPLTTLRTLVNALPELGLTEREVDIVIDRLPTRMVEGSGFFTPPDARAMIETLRRNDIAIIDTPAAPAAEPAGAEQAGGPGAGAVGGGVLVAGRR